MRTLYAILGYPLGWLMYFIYNIFHNYGVALIVFTILTRLIMVPFAIKQQKGMAKMASFRPMMMEIQNKYKNNPQKMQEEMAMLYQRENYNPMSGCLPMFIQFPILFGLIDVIYYPLKHILRMSADTISAAGEIAKTVLEQSGLAMSNSFASEMGIIKAVNISPDSFASLGEGFLEQVQNFDFTFMGMDLGVVPTFAFNIFILIPVLSFITSLLVSYITTKMNAQNMGDSNQGAAMNFTMMIMMPIMSAWISFSVPVGVGLYWIISNILMIVQSLIMNKIYNPKEMAEKAQAEAEARRQKEREEKIEARKRAREGEITEKALSSKDVSRMKINAARKRMAEKYGEEYNDEEESK